MKRIIILHGDISSVAVDAITNPAHASLLPGSGLCGYLHKKAGKTVEEECRALYKQDGMTPDGSARVTQAGDLPAHHLIHAVSPRWINGERNEPALLHQTYESVLEAAERVEARTVSVPALAVGIHRFPKRLAADIALKSLMDGLTRCRFVETVFIITTDEISCCAYDDLCKNHVGMTAGLELLCLLPSEKKSNL